MLRDPRAVAPLLSEVFGALGVPVALDAPRRPSGTRRSAAGSSRCCAARCSTAAPTTCSPGCARPGLLRAPALADRLEARARQAGARTAAAARALWEAEHWPLDAIDRVAAAHAPRPGRAAASASPPSSRRCSPRRTGARPRSSTGRRRAGRRACSSPAAARSSELRAIVARRPARSRPSPARARRAARGARGRARRRAARRRVTVSEPLALRARRVRALFLCGLQEGVFPAPARPEPFLGDAERAAIAAASGLRLRRHDEPRRRALPVLRDGLAARGAPVPRPGTTPTTTASRPCARSSSTTSRRCSAASCRERRAHAHLGAVGWPAAPRRPSASACAARPPPARATARRRSPRCATPRSSRELRERAGVVGVGHRAVGGLPGEVVRRAPAAPRRPEPDPEPMLRGAARARGARGDAARPRRADRQRALTPRTAAARARARDDGARAPAREPAAADVARPRRQRALAHRLRGRPAALRRARRAATARSSCRRRFEVDFGGADDEHPALELAGGVRIRGRIDRIDTGPRRRGDRLRLQGPHRARRPRAGARSASSSSRCTCSPRATCSTSSRSAASTSRSARKDLRPRGRVLDDADPDLDDGRDRPPRRARSSTRSSTACSRTCCGAVARAARGRARAAPGDLRAGRRRLRVPDDLPVRAHERRVSSIGPGGRPFTDEQAAAIRRARRPAAARGRRRQRQDVGARRALRALGARRRRAPAADPRDHVHREGRRRAARARARALPRARRARRGARDRGRVDLDDPRLLRAACCAGTRSPPASIPRFTVLDETVARDAARRGVGRARSRRWLDGARGDAALDLAAAYDADRLRDGDRRGPRRAAQRRPDAPARCRAAPAGADPRALRAALAAAARGGRAELGLARRRQARRPRRGALERCGELLRARPARRRPPARARRR